MFATKNYTDYLQNNRYWKISPKLEDALRLKFGENNEFSETGWNEHDWYEMIRHEISVYKDLHTKNDSSMNESRAVLLERYGALPDEISVVDCELRLWDDDFEKAGNENYDDFPE